jgi:hypothetical protein
MVVNIFGPKANLTRVYDTPTTMICYYGVPFTMPHYISMTIYQIDPTTIRNLSLLCSQFITITYLVAMSAQFNIGKCKVTLCLEYNYNFIKASEVVWTYKMSNNGRNGHKANLTNGGGRHANFHDNVIMGSGFSVK